MTVNTNPLEGLVKVIVVLIVIGILLGTLLSNTDLFNPRTSAAKANQLDAETAHQQAMNQLNERLAAAKTDAEIKAVQREEMLQDAKYQYDMQMLAQDLTHKETAFKARLMVFELGAIALVLALVMGVLLWFAGKAFGTLSSASWNKRKAHERLPSIEKNIRVMPERIPYDPWYSPQYRLQRRMAAKQKEQKFREAELLARMRNIKYPAQISSEEYNNSPLVE